MGEYTLVEEWGFGDRGFFDGFGVDCCLMEIVFGVEGATVENEDLLVMEDLLDVMLKGDNNLFGLLL